MDATDIVVDLPTPPSVNRLWRATGSDRKRVYLAPSYKRWQQQADSLVMLNRQAPRGRMIRGPFEAHIAVSVNKRQGADIDNRIKSVLDYAQSREFVLNDKFCTKVTAEWVRAELAPHGCRLTLRTIDSV